MVVLALRDLTRFIQSLVELGVHYKAYYIVLIALNMLGIILREVRIVIDVQKARELKLDY